MNKLAAIALLIATLGAVGCATDATTSNSGVGSLGTEQPVTGSRLPPPKPRQ
jgi:hypothetical protein